jgi:hypothetical protein
MASVLALFSDCCIEDSLRSSASTLPWPVTFMAIAYWPSSALAAACASSSCFLACTAPGAVTLVAIEGGMVA